MALLETPLPIQFPPWPNRPFLATDGRVQSLHAASSAPRGHTPSWPGAPPTAGGSRIRWEKLVGWLVHSAGPLLPRRVYRKVCDSTTLPLLMRPPKVPKSRYTTHALPNKFCLPLRLLRGSLPSSPRTVGPLRCPGPCCTRAWPTPRAPCPRSWRPSWCGTPGGHVVGMRMQLDAVEVSVGRSLRWMVEEVVDAALGLWGVGKWQRNGWVG